MTADIETHAAPSKLTIFKNHNFRVLWFGSVLSQFADQFYLIALPWLVLVITDDNAMALGTIMAAAGIPRAVFMLVGGAVTDRVSPKLILIASTLARAILVGLVAFLILSDMIELWALFVLAIAFGFADAFAIPAGASLMPRIVEEEHLAPANALLHGAIQVSGIAGPAAAGGIIAFFGSDMSGIGAQSSTLGIG